VLDRLLEVDPGALNDRLRLYELSSYAEFDFGADIRQLSSRYLEDDSSFRGKDQIVTNGYDRLANLLAHKVDILYRQAVNRVEAVGNEWKVSTPVMDHFADDVVVAVPLGVLKAGTIDFVPGLPDGHTSALSRMQMGVVNKVVLQWDAPFWDTGLQYIGYTPAEKGKYNYFLNFRKFSSHNVLMTFAFGDFAVQMESDSDAQVQADVMAHLRSIYGNGIPNPTAMVRSKWGSDPLFRGAYTSAMVGMNGNEFEDLAAPAGDRLHLVGEHCSQKYRGTVHGAYLSGEAVAERIMDRLDK
jgi:monoamine oxidase